MVRQLQPQWHLGKARVVLAAATMKMIRMKLSDVDSNGGDVFEDGTTYSNS